GPGFQPRSWTVSVAGRQQRSKIGAHPGVPKGRMSRAREWPYARMRGYGLCADEEGAGMYGWIWRRLPFGLPGKIIGSVLLIAGAVALLWYWVFPAAEP